MPAVGRGTITRGAVVALADGATEAHGCVVPVGDGTIVVHDGVVPAGAGTTGAPTGGVETAGVVATEGVVTARRVGAGAVLMTSTKPAAPCGVIGSASRPICADAFHGSNSGAFRRN